MLEGPRAQRVLRSVLAAFFAAFTLLFLLLAPITGLFSLPFALVTAGLAHGVSDRGPDDTTPETARWMITIGVVLVACEIVFFLLFAGKG